MLALGWMLGSPAPPDAGVSLWAGRFLDCAHLLWDVVCEVLCKGGGSLDCPGDSRLCGSLPSFDLQAVIASLNIVHLPKQPQLSALQMHKLQWTSAGIIALFVEAVHVGIRIGAQFYSGRAEQCALLS